MKRAFGVTGKRTARQLCGQPGGKGQFEIPELKWTLVRSDYREGRFPKVQKSGLAVSREKL